MSSTPIASSAATPLVIDFRGPLLVGLFIVVFGVVGFFLWAGFAPLHSAAIAEGVVIADSRNKTVQHLEGGIVQEILVAEGDRIAEGQTLVRLESVRAEASLDRLITRRRAALALEARLIAESERQDAIGFPAELLEHLDEPEIEEVVAGQRALFEARQASTESGISILRQRISQYEREIDGLEAQIASENRQIELIEQELASVRELFESGLERKPRLLALQGSRADLLGRKGEHEAQIARARQNIGEMDERILALTTERVDQAVSKLRDVQTQLSELDAEIEAAADISRRLEVTAPVAGTVVRLHQNTPGGVVKPGEPILELVPEADDLVIEAAVKPEDIDSVQLGAPARAKLTAYSRRRSSDLLGEVTHVSADRVVSDDERSAWFVARVTVSGEELARHPEIRLYPGMTAEVFITAGEQTVLEYLLLPLVAGMDRAFREQ
jgi:HlyD family secretion protein